jgi:alkylhydroperoxidase/carboxymuconolactone decarboxylase family protein YurZ
MQRWQQILVGLTLDDPNTVSVALARGEDVCRLPASTEALVKLAAVCASCASDHTFERIVAEALDAGASKDEIVQVLVACAPLIGGSRLVRTASPLAAALHFDLDGHLESLDGM